MNRTENESTASTSRWPRRLLILAFLLVGLILSLVGYIWYVGHRGDTKLSETLADLDRTDPGWRWEEIQLQRSMIPDAQNSALHILHVKRLLPNVWGGTLDEMLLGVGSAEVLTDAQAAALESELAKVGPALGEARRLVDLPAGRFPEQHGPNPLHLLLNHVQEVRTVIRLLGFDAIAQAQNQNMEAAVLAVHAGLNASRSIGDELTLIAQLVRLACRGAMVRRLERVLAQGEANDASLAALQKAMDEDEAEPLYLYAIRGERAFAERMHHALKAGPESIPLDLRTEFEYGYDSSEKYKIGSVDFEVLLEKLVEEGTSGQYADLLRGMTEAVDIARRPLEEQHAPLIVLEASTAKKSRIVRSQMPMLVKVHEACLRVNAEMRSAVAALAAERYRLAHGRWPESLKELVDAKLLPKIPIDPYTKDPLFFQDVADGLIIYSVGLDRKDDGGKLVRGEMSWNSEHDVGIRLWDAKARRQPAIPKPAVTDAMP